MPRLATAQIKSKLGTRGSRPQAKAPSHRYHRPTEAAPCTRHDLPSRPQPAPPAVRPDRPPRRAVPERPRRALSPATPPTNIARRRLAPRGRGHPQEPGPPFMPWGCAAPCPAAGARPPARARARAGPGFDQNPSIATRMRTHHTRAAATRRRRLHAYPNLPAPHRCSEPLFEPVDRRPAPAPRRRGVARAAKGVRIESAAPVPAGELKSNTATRSRAASRTGERGGPRQPPGKGSRPFPRADQARPPGLAGITAFTCALPYRRREKAGG